MPENAKLQKETVLSLVKGSTVFINYLGMRRYVPVALYLTADHCGSGDVCDSTDFLRRLLTYLVRAHDVALSKQHKSISASDVLKALEMIEFGDLVEMLQNELQSKTIPSFSSIILTMPSL